MNEVKGQACFGEFEDDVVAWHCRGCLLAEECRAYQLTKQKEVKDGETE